MSYFMVHLRIARRVRELCPWIQDAKAFDIGALAPDALAFRPGCVRRDKKATHFTPPGFEWAEVTDNEAWKHCANEGLQAYASHGNQSFWLGCRTHLLTDIANNERFWLNKCRPLDKTAFAVCLADLAEVDNRLLADFGGSEALFPALEADAAYAFPPLFTAEDVARMLAVIKTDMYANRLPDASFRFTYIHYDEIIDFIEEAALEIAAELNREKS